MQLPATPLPALLCGPCEVLVRKAPWCSVPNPEHRTPKCTRARKLRLPRNLHTDSPRLYQRPKWFSCFALPGCSPKSCGLDHMKWQLAGYSRWKLPDDLEAPASRKCPYSHISQNFMQKSRLFESHKPMSLVILPWNLCLKKHHNLAAEISVCIGNMFISPRPSDTLNTDFLPTQSFLICISLTTKTLYLIFCSHAHKERYKHYYKWKKKYTMINWVD